MFDWGAAARNALTTLRLPAWPECLLQMQAVQANEEEPVRAASTASEVVWRPELSLLQMAARAGRRQRQEDTELDRVRPATPGGGRFIPEAHGKASTEVHDKTSIGQHTGEFGRRTGGPRWNLVAQK